MMGGLFFSHIDSWHILAKETEEVNLRSGTIANDESEFLQLLDGEEAEKWKLFGSMPIRLKDGVIDTESPKVEGAAILWYRAKEFNDFTLRFQFKRREKTGQNSGIFVRISEPVTAAERMDYHGYQIDISDARSTGAISGYQNPSCGMEVPGDWNDMEITVIGSHIRVILNRQVINDYEACGAASGFIGVERFGGGSGVQYRKLRIRELNPKATQIPQPQSVEESLVSSGWNIGQEGTKDEPVQRVFFLPDGKVKDDHFGNRFWRWFQTGPLEFCIRTKSGVVNAMRFTDESFQKFSEVGSAETIGIFGVRSVPIAPPIRIMAGVQRIPPSDSAGRPLNLGFEDGTLKDWTVDGDAFVGQPVKGQFNRTRDPGDHRFFNFHGNYWIGTFETAGDFPMGVLRSVPFKVTCPWASFLVGGGALPGVRVEVVGAANQKIIHTARGADNETMERSFVDLHDLLGQEIFLRVVDEEQRGWGHINFDDFVFHPWGPTFEDWCSVHLDPSTHLR